MLVRFVVEVDSTLPPERVVNGFTDFSAKRLERWSGLSRKKYVAHTVGATTAEVTEGSDTPFSVWAREKYDWGTPGVVRWTVLDSDFCNAGHSMVVTVTPRPTGSHFRLDYERSTKGLKGLVVGVMMALVGRSVMMKYYRESLSRWGVAGL